MHMDEVVGSCRLLQRIDILRDREHLPGKVTLESCERTMRGIGSRLGLPAPAQIVEVVHLGGIAGKTFRRRHLLKIELRPQPALVAKGAEPALSGEARAGQDDDVVEAHASLRFESPAAFLKPSLTDRLIEVRPGLESVVRVFHSVYGS